MDNLKKILEVLNDLIRINKDREEGYVKVSRELTPAEHNLRSSFERKAQESRNNIIQLEHVTDEIHQQLNYTEEQAQEANQGMTGRIYKLWSEIKDFFGGKDKPSVLKSCADGEARAKTCYENALEEVQLPKKIYALLNDQISSIDASQREIKSLLEKGGQ